MTSSEHNLIQTLYLIVLKLGKNGVLEIPDVEQMVPLLTNKIGIGMMIENNNLYVMITERSESEDVN